MNLENLFFPWMEHQSIIKGQRPNTVSRYETFVRGFFTWCKENGRPTDPGEVTRDDIGEWMKALFYDQGNLSNRSRASKLSALRSFYSWLNYSGRLNHNPSKEIPSPRITESLPQIFSTDELRKIFAGPDRGTIRGIRDLAILKTMYAAGTRVSELTGLDMNHVIDSGGYIRLQIVDSKGGKSRMVTLRNNPSKALREWLLIRREMDCPDQALFLGLRKNEIHRLGTKSIQAVLKKYAKRVGIKDADIFVHKMRSTFATNLYDSGNDHCPHCRRAITYVGPVEVAMLLGHDPGNLSTVMRYIAISERVLKKTAIPDRRFNEIEAEG